MMPVSNFIWSYILVYLLLGAGLLFTIMTRDIQLRLFRHMAYMTFTARGAGDGISELVDADLCRVKEAKEG